jgi:hypothetical protein
MILPTDTEGTTLRAYALRTFGASKLLLVQLPAPVEAALIVVPFDAASFADYLDMKHRPGGARTANASAVLTRTIWCSPVDVDRRPGAKPSATMGGDAPAAPTIDMLVSSEKDPDPVHRVAVERSRMLTATWPAADAEIAEALDDAAGWGGLLPRASLLTARDPPPGLSGEDAARLLEGRPPMGPGSLWAVTCADKPLGLVLAAPHGEVWHASQKARNDALGARKGIMDATLLYLRPAGTVVWCEGAGFEALVAERPGLASWLWKALEDIGGAAAKASASSF